MSDFYLFFLNFRYWSRHS